MRSCPLVRPLSVKLSDSDLSKLSGVSMLLLRVAMFSIPGFAKSLIVFLSLLSQVLYRYNQLLKYIKSPKIQLQNPKLNSIVMGAPTFQAAVYFNLILLKINAFLFSFPISVDLKEQRIRPNDSPIRQIFWHLGLGFLAFKTAYVVGTFAATSTVPDLYNEIHFPLHFVFVTGHLLSTPVGHILFNVHRDSFIHVWNTLLADLPQAEIDSPMQLQFALGFPVLTTCGVLASTIMFALDQSWIQQLHFVVSAMRKRGYLGDGGCALSAASLLAHFVDMYTIMLIPALVCCIGISHIGTFEVTYAVMKKTAKDAKLKSPQTNCRNMRRLQLMIRQFNDCHSSIVYLDKLTCMYTGTFGLSALLLANFVHPITTSMTAYISIMCIAKFPTVCHKAYPIYEKMDELKRLTLLRSSDTLESRRVVSKTVRSIHNEGISVGGFRRFERDAFLVYGGFIFNTLASILLSSK